MEPRVVRGKNRFVNDKIEARRLLAEEEILESERKYRELYETVRDGIVATDLEGNILECNRAYLDMVGYSAAEIRKKKYQNLTPKKWHKMEAEIVANQIKARGYSDEYEKEYIKKDGTVFPVSVMVWLKKDREGKPIGMWKIVRDITDLKQTEERYQIIIKNFIDGFWIADTKGQFLEVNDAYCRMIGYSRDELLKMKIPDIEANEKPEETAQRIRKIIKTGGDRFETKHRRKDGKIIDIEVSANYLPVQDGRMVVFLRDITERKRVERKKEKIIEKILQITEELKEICRKK